MHNHQALNAPGTAVAAQQHAHQAAAPKLVVSAAATAGPVVPRPAPAPVVVAAPPPPRPPTAPTPVQQHAVRPPAPARRPERRGNPVVRRITALQVVCWQIAVTAVALSIGRPWPVTAGAGVGAAALLAVTALRIRGRWLYQVLAPSAGFLLRTRRHNLPEDGKALALLGLLLPGSTTVTVHTGQGTALVISHAGGLTALVRPRSTGRTQAPPPLPTSLLPAADGTPHHLGIQLVFHSGARSDQPARFWLTVHASRTVDAPTDTELEPVLRNAVRRVVRSLNRAGVPAEPMPAEAALATVAALGHVTGGRTEVREDWGFWRTGVVTHTCFRLAGWERLAEHEVNNLLTGLAARTAGIAVTLTIAAQSAPGVPPLTAVLRLAAPTESAVEAATSYLTRPLASYGVRLVRLDGSQVAAVAASLPIGGFPQ
ncbi:type VII secretion protein EccE [Nocardia sp. NRRL S-836]|uniref:type VII secretion protein EccE n=1 Tax=Nocardia sp. NRRL S-836 TaxID=1519492 RepID=UPI0006AFD82B|nr:type VII secretion protein EccE [Nocardia sp. NRRL S-836]